jgi:hypothetical protein
MMERMADGNENLVHFMPLASPKQADAASGQPVSFHKRLLRHDRMETFEGDREADHRHIDAEHDQPRQDIYVLQTVNEITLVRAGPM